MAAWRRFDFALGRSLLIVRGDKLDLSPLDHFAFVKRVGLTKRCIQRLPCAGAFDVDLS